MGAILISGVDRPGLAKALARHALAIGGQAVAALIGADVVAPRLPTLVEARDADAAAALLDRGADDVVLASDPDRLVAARLAALVRRNVPRLAIGDLAIDPVERRVTRAGRPITLLPREYAVLLHLIRHADAIVSRGELAREVLGLRFDPGTNVVAVHVSRLRAKLDATGGPPMLVTERGRGYRLAAA